MICCIAPSPSIDRLFESERLTVGTIHRPNGFVQVPGGKALNVARVAYALGAHVRVIAILGGYAGAWIRDQLTRLGIEGTYLWEDQETRSCLSVFDRSRESLTEFYEDPAQCSVKTWNRLIAAVEDSLPATSWLCVSGGAPPGLPDGAYGELVSLSLAHGVDTAVDTSGLGLHDALLASPTLVKINVDEAQSLFPTENRGDSLALASALHGRLGGTATVCVTSGTQGAVILDSEGRCWRGHPPAHDHYSVGSGDAFLAGLLVGQEFGSSWHESLALALAAGAANAEKPGAGVLDAARCRQLAQTVAIREITA